MKHTECKDCEFSNGDCGHHFKMDGTTNFDIASLGACDKYENCMFFKSKAKPKGDLISREALKKALKSNCKPEICHDYNTAWCEACCPHNDFEDLIDSVPTVFKALVIDDMSEEKMIEFTKAWHKFQSQKTIIEDERPQGEWIAVKDKLPDTDGCYLVSLEDGRIVVADERGIIENHDFEPKMLAWQPLPEPYTKGGAE